MAKGMEMVAEESYPIGSVTHTSDKYLVVDNRDVHPVQQQHIIPAQYNTEEKTEPEALSMGD